MPWLRILLCCCGIVLGASLEYNPYCEILDEMKYRFPNFFASRLDPVQPVTYVNGVVTALFPPLEQQRYKIEAVRGNGSQCLFCPYQNAPDGVNPIVYDTGGVAYVRSPMYGPCLDRKRAIKVACTQNTLLFPPTFCGEYFYPDQTIMAHTAIVNTENYAEHRMITSETTENKLPTDYALGRGRIRENLLGSSFRSSATGLINETLTAQFFGSYLKMTDTEEGWPLWAQHYCTPGCHRNAEYFWVSVRESDWKGKSPILQYLNRVNSDSTNVTSMTRCNLCPRFQAAYWWSKINRCPIDQLTWNTVASACYPWFGAVPVTNGGEFATLPVVVHGAASDGVLIPTTSTYVETEPCAVNTYNDVCAHSILYYRRVALGLDTDDTLTPSQAAIKGACKPCPAGYHTDGKTGAWFCLPPVGQLMTNRKKLLGSVDANNESIAWSRRDTLGYEFECGYTLSHCIQCPLFQKTLLPDEFNQEMILTPLLKTEPCPIGYYCPHPLRQDPIQCPAEKPWSPAGSSSITSCACAMGTFLNAGVCTACPAWDSCPLGQYLQDWNKCVNLDGATSPGVCVSCSNKPTNAVYTGSGIERFSGSNPGVGVCPFSCDAGLALVGTGTGSSCFYALQCQALKPYVSSSGIPVYGPNLLTLRDSLTVKATGCTLITTLSNTMASWADRSPFVSTTCLGKNGCTISSPCRVTQAATYGTDVVCGSCPAAPAAASYTQAARDQVIGSSTMCQYECDQANHYVDAGSCQSCVELATRVCGEGTWQIRGGGCLGNHTPFTAVLDKTWCVSCSKRITEVPLGQYLNSELCEFIPCARLMQGQTYRKVACKESNPGEIANCTLLSECKSDRQYLAGACTADSTPVCTDCVFFNPGFYMLSNCTFNTEPAIWAPCPAGSYCDGSMNPPRLCPFPQTSRAGSSGECFCPAGMMKRDSDNTCIPTICPDAVPSLLAPGGVVRSSYFMELDPSTLLTRCSPCPGTSFTLDAHAVSVASCRCPTGQSLVAGECVACSSSSCIGCWQGYCPASGSSVPFAPSPTQCATGFDKVPNVQPAVGGTGSAAYIEESNSKAGWSMLYTSSRTTITQLAITGSRDDDGLPNTLQIALFAIGSTTIYVMPLPPLDYGGANPLTAYAFWCPAFDSAHYISAQLAVARWPRLNQFNDLGSTFNAAYSAFVGQVAYNLQDNSLLLFTNQVSLTNTGNPAWFAPDGCDSYKQRETLIADNFYPNQTSIPAMHHQFAYPGGTTLINTFYIAFNHGGQCGVIAFNADANIRTALDLSGERHITAMAVLVSGMLPRLYVAFDTSPGSIKLIHWGQAESDELFFMESPPAVTGLSYAWLSDQILWARVRSGDGFGVTSIYTADRNYQRTFTLVEQLPIASHPTLGPLVVSTLSQTGLMVAASQGSIFTLPVSRCSPAYDARGVLRARYWDGSACKMNMCVRGRSCAGAAGQQYYNETLQRCMCSPGYYETQQLTCADCPAASYCVNNQKIACGGALTSKPNARSEWGCVCELGQLSRASGCSDCVAGTWCPNRWESQACPGGMDVARTRATRSIYPYTCVCAAGFSGPGCTPCPAGKYCSIVSGSMVTNYALGLTITLYKPDTAVCDIIRSRISTYFQSAGASAQIYCVFLPSLTPRTDSMVIFMIQTASFSATDQLASIWTNFTAPQGEFMAVAMSPQMASMSVPNNEPRDCPTGKVPLADGTVCQCAPGYETTASNQCAGCKANFFKATAGAGACTACPTGTISAAGASACSNRQASNSSTTTDTATSTNVPVIAGGVVGGLVVVGLVIMGINQVYTVPAT